MDVNGISYNEKLDVIIDTLGLKMSRGLIMGIYLNRDSGTYH